MQERYSALKYFIFSSAKRTMAVRDINRGTALAFIFRRDLFNNLILHGGENMKNKCINLIAVLVMAFAIHAKADNIAWNGDGGNNGNTGWNEGYVVERQILCESLNHSPAACMTGLDRTQNIYLARQISDAPCVEGSSYSFYQDRINVGGGCRGYFIARGVTHEPLPTDKVVGGDHNGGGSGHHPWQHEVSYKILCESFDGMQNPIKKSS
jgi:hypothetical protein